ncbi:MAG: DUF21 domain-containing protein [Tetrasphaera sp.]
MRWWRPFCVTLAVATWVDGFWVALLIAIAVMTLISFAIVGVSPRTLGRQHSDAVALATAPVLVWFRRILGPVSRSLVAIANAVTPGRGYRDGPFQSGTPIEYPHPITVLTIKGR